MNFWMGVLTGFYFLIALGMCGFILLMNEDNEGMGAPSIMSPVRSSQKGSVLQQIIWILISLFFGTCILLNRLQSGNFIVNVLLQKKNKESPQTETKTTPPTTVEAGSTKSVFPETQNPFNITDEVLESL